jgi:hypothetical protein
VLTGCVDEFKVNKEIKIWGNKLHPAQSLSKIKTEKKLYKPLAEMLHTERTYVEEVKSIDSPPIFSQPFLMILDNF